MESIHKILNPKLCQCSAPKRREIIASLSFLKKASAATLEDFQVSFTSRNMEEGQELSPLALPRGLFGIVAAGALKVFRYVKDDQFVILDVLVQGDFFHYGFPDAPGVRMFVYPDQVQAMTTSCLLFMDSTKLEELLRRDADLSATYLESMSGKLNQLHQRFIHLGSYHADHKLAYLLEFLLSKGPAKVGYPGLIPFNITRKDLASLAGLTLETASRILASFERSGLIRSGRGWVEILDSQGLSERCRTEQL